jgi:hypothetical protein
VLFGKYNCNDQIKDGMGRECSNYWREEECIESFYGKGRKK